VDASSRRISLVSSGAGIIFEAGGGHPHPARGSGPSGRLLVVTAAAASSSHATVAASPACRRLARKREEE
jgi:hypothetical protein